LNLTSLRFLVKQRKTGLPPIARALAAEGDLDEALEILVTLVESKQRAAERNEPGWFDSFYGALASFVRLVEARIEAGDVEGL